ncbi:hypothetical protein PIB30_097762 [Stylosanthes scabra]|uniref:Uncharacterized protein n=1 Tax=Stylosanthes scabra TaxID=79078 RepID=A0ABU6TW24_9FABA|nr:hypothetical protein [Stylosanthes scabra]
MDVVSDMYSDFIPDLPPWWWKNVIPSGGRGEMLPISPSPGAKWPPPHWQGRVGLSFMRSPSYKYMECAAKSSDQSHTHPSKKFPHLSIYLNSNGRYTCYCLSQWGNITIGEGVMFSCEEPVWVMIPSLVSLLDLKNVILVNLGEAGKKEVTRILYRMPVAVANTFVNRKMPLRTDQNVTMMFSYHRGISSVFAIELCVQLQEVGGSSSSSNHMDSGRGININDAIRIPPNRRASSPSPSFSPYVNRPAEEHPPEVSLFQDHAGVVAIHSPDLDDDQAGVNSDGGDDDEFITRITLAAGSITNRRPSDRLLFHASNHSASLSGHHPSSFLADCL